MHTFDCCGWWFGRRSVLHGWQGAEWSAVALLHPLHLVHDHRVEHVPPGLGAHAAGLTAGSTAGLGLLTEIIVLSPERARTRVVIEASLRLLLCVADWQRTGPRTVPAWSKSSWLHLEPAVLRLRWIIHVVHVLMIFSILCCAVVPVNIRPYIGVLIVHDDCCCWMLLLLKVVLWKITDCLSNIAQLIYPAQPDLLHCSTGDGECPDHSHQLSSALLDWLMCEIHKHLCFQSVIFLLRWIQVAPVNQCYVFTRYY